MTEKQQQWWTSFVKLVVVREKKHIKKSRHVWEALHDSRVYNSRSWHFMTANCMSMIICILTSESLKSQICIFFNPLCSLLLFHESWHTFFTKEPSSFSLNLVISPQRRLMWNTFFLLLEQHRKSDWITHGHNTIIVWTKQWHAVFVEVLHFLFYKMKYLFRQLANVKTDFILLCSWRTFIFSFTVTNLVMWRICFGLTGIHI